jgi:hypothetical protein
LDFEMNLRDLIAKMDELSEAETTPAIWTPTPEQEKWLGGANRQDPYILNRMPGAKPPITHFTDPADQALAKRLGFPAAAPAPAPAPAPAQQPAAAPVAAPAPNATATQNAAQQAALASGAQDDVTGVDAAVAAQQAAPANVAGKPERKLLPVDKNVQAYQDALIKAGVPLPRFGADGRWGSETSQASMNPKAQAVNQQFAGKIAQLQQTPTNVAAKPAKNTSGNVTSVSPANQNMAGTKSKLTPAEIKAAQDALNDPSTGPRDREYFKQLLANQPAAGSVPTTGPQGQPLIKGSDGSMGYYLNPVVKKGWQVVVPAPANESIRYDIEGYLLETFKFDK